MKNYSLPSFIQQYFWGDNLKELQVENNKNYIVQTLLERGNQKALTWLFSIFSKTDIKSMLSKTKLSKKSANFWQIYLS